MEKIGITRITEPVVEYQISCPYCNAETFRKLSLEGHKGFLTCEKCKNKFLVTFGKINYPSKFEGGCTPKQGVIRVIVQGREEAISIQTEKKMFFKADDVIAILWKKGLFNEYKPNQIINYTNYSKTLI